VSRGSKPFGWSTIRPRREYLEEVPGPCWRSCGGRRGGSQSRAAGVAALQAQRVAESVARWMATNLEEELAGWRWRIDPTDMEAMFVDFFHVDLWSVVESPSEKL
jgi:hypothetical protein